MCNYFVNPADCPKPLLESDSISSLAKRLNSDQVFDDSPVFNHWFGTSLYNVHKTIQDQLQKNSSSLSVSLQEATYSIETKDLYEASKRIKFATEMKNSSRDHGICGSSALRDAETTFSTVVASTLQNLCYGGDWDASIVHQGPVRKRPKTSGNPDTADMLGFRYLQSQPVETFFVSDLKLENYELSEKESALYGKFGSLSAKKGNRDSYMVVGLAATRYNASLWIYVMVNKRVMAIPIIRLVPIWDVALLGTLCVALRYLAQSPILYKVLPCPMPLKEISLEPLKPTPRNRTYLNRQDGVVMKFFCNGDTVLKGNIDLMQLAGVEASKKAISIDEHYYAITYPYYNGDHKPTNIRQCYRIIQMLDKLHSNGYVHGDVRLSNLVFDDEGQEGYLIDYDFCGKDGQARYPINYYFSDIRHREATEGKIMFQYHDRYSLAEIISQHLKDDVALLIEQQLRQPNVPLQEILNSFQN